MLAGICSSFVAAAGAAEPATAPAATAQAATARPATTQAPDFALRSAAGPNFRLSEYRGDVVVLSFWSSRCNVCRGQLSDLEGLYGTYRPAGFRVFGINVDDDGGAAREFARAQPVTYPMLLDPSKSMARAYRVDELPMLVAIDRFGAVRFVVRNNRRDTVRDYVPELRKLIDE